MDLHRLEKARSRHSAVQNTFSRAVAGIEATLEKEKSNSARVLKILDSINDGVAILDETGALKYANSALWRLYAIPPEHKNQYMDASWIELHSLKGQEEIRMNVLPVLETRKVWLGESDVQAKDGTMLRAELYISKTDDGYIGFIRDVTARHRAETERKILAHQLHDLQKVDAVESAVRTMIHEFSNGLASVGGFAEMLTEDLDECSQDFEYAERIYSSAQRMQGALEQARFLLKMVSARSN